MQKIYKITLTLLLFGMLPSAADAANLYFSPASGSYNVGSTISVSVYVSSSDQAMNAASGIVSFPSDKLQMVSLVKTGSVFGLWVQEPAFSNADATANFEGVVLNPGFTGAAAKIITANFKVQAAGSAVITFSSGSVLANDGKGTDILKNLGSAEFSLGGASPSIPESTTPSLVSGTPAAPQISSPTHPNPDKWYAEKDAKFIWLAPADATGVRLLVGKIPRATPIVAYAPAVNEKEAHDMPDGIWYFHAQLRNANGWGEISHFRFQVDTGKPSRFDITEVPREDPTEPRATFIFDAKDDVSGIDHYEVQIDGGNTQTWIDDGNHHYQTQPMATGKHVLIGKAVDKAGNLLTSSIEFFTEGIAPPVITKYPSELQSGESLLVRGTAVANGRVIIFLQKDKDDAKSFTVASDTDGNFTFMGDEKLTDGIYKLWAEAVDGRGAKSLPSEKLTIPVTKLAIFRIGAWAINFLAIVIPLLALVLVLLFLLWYGWHKFLRLRRRLRKEVREAESALHKSFDLLKEDIQDQVKMLERVRSKRELTKEEEKILKQFKGNLTDAERFVEEKIETIEKEVR